MRVRDSAPYLHDGRAATPTASHRLSRRRSGRRTAAIFHAVARKPQPNHRLPQVACRTRRCRKRPIAGTAKGAIHPDISTQNATVPNTDTLGNLNRIEPTISGRAGVVADTADSGCHWVLSTDFFVRLVGDWHPRR